MHSCRVALSFIAVSLVVACTVGGSDYVSSSGPTDPGDGGASSSGSSGSTASSGSSGSSGTTRDAGSCFDPTCPQALCECKDKTAYAPSGVCRKNGQCDVLSACEEACGEAGFGGSYWKKDACSSPNACAKSQPSVECACNEGFGYDAYPTCFEGYCAWDPEHVCPKTCASDGGWSCKSALDCAPIACACKDGRNPIAASPCSGGSCSTASAVCPTACSDHGGWSGTGTTTKPDAGAPGPKAPGESCTKASECTPFACTCNNGSTFGDNKLCTSKTCATQAQTCGFICMNSGGWSGT